MYCCAAIKRMAYSLKHIDIRNNICYSKINCCIYISESWIKIRNMLYGERGDRNVPKTPPLFIRRDCCDSRCWSGCTACFFYGRADDWNNLFLQCKYIADDRHRPRKAHPVWQTAFCLSTGWMARKPPRFRWDLPTGRRKWHSQPQISTWTSAGNADCRSQSARRSTLRINSRWDAVWWQNPWRIWLRPVSQNRFWR